MLKDQIITLHTNVRCNWLLWRDPSTSELFTVKMVKITLWCWLISCEFGGGGTLQTRRDKSWQRRTIHEKPVSSQHPDEHQHDGEGEGQELSQSETPTAAEGNSAIRQDTS